MDSQMKRLPNIQTKKWIVSYTGKFFGDIIRAFNLDLFSDKGRVKTGAKVYPHTIQADIATLESITAFTKANISDGTARGNKLWGVSNKIVASKDDGTFEVITEDGFGVGEEVGTNNDIISVVDEREDDLEAINVSITGEEKTFYLGRDANFLKVAQGLRIKFPITELKINLWKTGSPDDFTISIQGDDNGEPDGVNIVSKIFTHTEIDTSPKEFIITDFANEILKGNYWLILEKGGIADNSNHYKFNYIRGINEDDDPYENGELKRWTGTAWITYKDTLLTETATEYTNGGEDDLWGTTWTPAEINSADFGITRVEGSTATTPDTTYSIDFIKIKVYYEDGGEDKKTEFMFPSSNTALPAPRDDSWTNPTNAYSDNGSYATALNIKYHCWHNFGFAIPGTATIKGIEVVMKAKIETDFEAYLWGGLTKDAETIAGSFLRFGMKPPIDAKLTINSIYPQSDEKVYLTTNEDVIFLGDEDDKWYSLWQGILQEEELNSDYPAILKNLGAGGTLLLANENKIHSFIATATSSSEVTPNRLIFDPTHYVNWIRLTNSAVFIGLRHKEGEGLPSQVVYYEPSVERTRTFIIEEGATMGFIKDENCHIIDKLGQIRVFTGSSFRPYLYFPCYYRDEKLTTLPHRNGIITRGDIVKIAWKGQYPDPAGIWVIEDGNLYHKHSLVFDKTNFNSIGAMEVNSTGALYEENEIYIGASLVDGAGNDVKGAYSTIKTAVSDETRSRFETSKLITSEIKDIWQDVVLKYDPVSGGDIKVKYKAEPNKVLETAEYSGTWTSSTTFTCNTAGFVSAVNSGDIEAGDEVIIRKGQGAGLLAHITEITGTTTKTVTIDEGLTAITNGTFTFSVEKWKEVNINLREDMFSAKGSLKDKSLENTQLKVEVRKHTLEEIQVSSTVDKTINK